MKYFVFFFLCCVAMAAAAPQLIWGPGLGLGSETIIAGPRVINNLDGLGLGHFGLI